jgi:hypothetical protein
MDESWGFRSVEPMDEPWHHKPGIRKRRRPLDESVRLQGSRRRSVETEGGRLRSAALIGKEAAPYFHRKMAQDQ